MLLLATLAVALSPTARSVDYPHVVTRNTAPQLIGAASPGPASFIAHKWSAYLVLLEERPMATKMATSAVLAGAGDVIAQSIEASGSFFLRRFLTLIAVNVLYIVPILTAFYALNEGVISKLKTPAGWKRTGIQLAFDQLVNAPIVVAGFFAAFQLFTAVGETLASGAPFALNSVAGATMAAWKSSYVSTVISNWKVWVLPQLLNFALVPPYARVAFANLIGLVWSVILSVIANA